MTAGASRADGSLPRAPLSGAAYFAVEFDPATGEVVLLDQRLLPRGLTYLRYRDATAVAAAITDMVVRGAPAIGITAAYGLAAHAREQATDADAFLRAHRGAAQILGAARPTAVNLGWAIARMGEVAVRHAGDSPVERAVALQHAAEAIHREDVAACKAMGALGAGEVPHGATILTHCNAGALATGGYGTALGVIRAAHTAGKNIRVLADETRPYLQGARLTAWELHQDGIDVEVVTDSMAGHFMQRGEIQFCVVGSDRIAANGDVANKIGTYGVAVLARHHGIPFTVAAPWSTVDLACPTGGDIPIEQRGRDEVAHVGGVMMVGDGIGCRHPAFDITPAGLVSRIYTERGAISPERGERPQQLAHGV